MNAQPQASTIGATSLLHRAEGCVAAAVGDQLLMLNMGNGRYYSFNSSAARIWELLESAATLRSICDRLAEEYAVEYEACRSSVERFVRAAAQRGLIRVDDSPIAA